MTLSKRLSGSRSLSGRFVSDLPETDPELANRLHHVKVMLDNSDSMRPYVESVCEGLNTFNNILIEGEHNLVRKYAGKATFRVSMKWLNGPWLIQDCPVSKLPHFHSGMYVCDGNTPLYGGSLEVLGELQEEVSRGRAQGKRPRGHMVWFSDGQATDGSDTRLVETLPLIIQNILNPVTPTGGRATQTIDLFAIPIGQTARPFYESIGVPGDNICAVSDAMGKAFANALARSSLKILESAGAAPDDLMIQPYPADALLTEVSPDEDPTEANGDAILRIMREKRAQLKSSQTSRAWPSR